jgi:hypothetical protein
MSGARVIAGSLLFAALAGCRGATEPPAPSPDRDIHVGVLQYCDRQFLAGEDWPVCVGLVSPGRAPIDLEQSVRAALARHRPDIHPASACRQSPDGVVLAATGRPAALLVSGPIVFRGSDEADVRGQVRRGPQPTVAVTYRLVREPGGWRCLGPIVIGLPL